MKKFIASIMVVFFILTMSVAPLLAAGSVSINLSSSVSTVRIGDTVTVTGSVNASQMLATFDLNVTYNAGQLQYVSADKVSPTVASGELDIGTSSGSIQFLYLDGDGGSSGITTGNAFKITFKVIGGNIGDTINVGCSVKTAGDSSAAAMRASSSGTNMTIAEPLATNNNLSTLTVNGGAMSPAFSPATTSYTMSVPFAVTKINVVATAEDPAAKVTISSPDLTIAGTTTLTITVTAPSRAKKTYTIIVNRAQDPNYKASNNANLKSLMPNQGLLSPVFSPDLMSYVIYLPYEIASFDATGEMEDAKALGVTSTEIQLKVGENAFTITGKAEDGTEKIYTIAVNRMPMLGSTPTTEATTTEATTTAATTTSGFRITISGILTDENGNPLAGKTVELHSYPLITMTDDDGYYQIENVTEGAHTLFLKDADGTEIAQLPIEISQGAETLKMGNEITTAGNTTIDLSLNKSGLSLKNVVETTFKASSVKVTPVSNGTPLYLVIILLLIALVAGGALGYFQFGKRKLPFSKKQ